MTKKGSFSKKIGVFVLMFFGGLVGFFAAQFGMRAAAHLPVTVVVALAILFIPAFFLVIAFHEGGHALAGSYVNFDFRMYVVGPLMWDKEEAGWKFKWNRNVNTSGGMVICMPVGQDDLPRRFSIYAAGGPLASFLGAVLFYFLYLFFNLLNSEGYMILLVAENFFFIMACLSLVIFLVTAIPVHTGGFSSDGARVWRLLRKGDTARFDLLMLKIITLSTGGLRPSEQNVDELNEARNLAEKLQATFGVYLHGIFHQVAFDRGDYDAAENHLKDYIRDADEIPQGIRSNVWLDAAFFYAYARKDLQSSLAHWKNFKPSAIIPKAQVFATEAAIGLLKEEYESVKQKIEYALRELPNMMDRGVAIALREKLMTLKNQFENISVHASNGDR
ncbi:MAG: M50 family metallopeptidase [Cyclobacteriaceae bacterium]|nr:M50 family metallopeptidase [Cyclobacteriaceae bacterium]